MFLGGQTALFHGPADTGRLAWLGHAVECTQSVHKTFKRDFAVTDLGPVFRSCHHHTRGRMRQAHRRLGAIDVLSTGTRGTVGIHAHLPLQRGTV